MARKGYKQSRSVKRIVVMFGEDAARLLVLIPELQQLKQSEITESMTILHALLYCQQEWNRYGDIFAFVCPSTQYAQRLYDALNGSTPDVSLDTVAYWDSLCNDREEV